MSDKNRTLLIFKKRMVAAVSVLLALVLVTTITFNSSYEVFAEGEDKTKTETEETQDKDGKTEEETEEDAEAKAKKEADEKAKKEAEKEAKEQAEAEKAVDDISIDDLLGSDDGSVGFELTPEMPKVSSSSYIVMSGSTSEVVIEKHSTRKMSPGKMTMLVTAMVVIDNMYNDEELKNTVDITSKLAGYGDTFEKGETVSVGDLLYSMLTGGDQQSAEALASYSASKRKIFINEMNSKAMELGLMDTNFTNPRGAYSTKQYSTAADLAVIMQAAARYPLIMEALEKRSFTATAYTGKEARTISFKSTNPLFVSEKPSELYRLSKGALMGTMSKPSTATQYAGVAVIDDMQLIVILMDSKESKIAYESKGLFEYANTLVTRNIIIESGEKVGSVRVRGGSSTKVSAYTANTGFAYVPPEGSEDLVQPEVVLYDNLEAPLMQGAKVGEYRIYVADELKGTVDLITKKNVPKGWLPSKIYISNFGTVMIGLLLLAVLIFFLRVAYVKRRRRKRREYLRQQKLRELAVEQLEIDEDRKKRNWTYSTSYDKVAPRTGDLRKEAEGKSGKKGKSGKSETSVNKNTDN